MSDVIKMTLWTPIFSMNVSLMSSKIHSIEWNWPNLFLEKNNQFSRQKYCTISVCNPQFVKYKFKLFWYILTIYKISTNWRHLYFFSLYSCMIWMNKEYLYFCAKMWMICVVLSHTGARFKFLSINWTWIKKYIFFLQFLH